jgi:SAM-dependent methyltransferase
MREAGVGPLTRLRGALLARRIRWDCPPWRGRGRYLDVGCGSGSVLGVAQALGWQVAGVEVDEAAARKARRFSPRVHAGDLLGAPFAAGEFDVVTSFHVLEHVPDPVAAVRRMLEWLDRDGLLVLEVPNAGGLGARLFGRAWSGLELPRHLSQFTPATIERVVTQAGGLGYWLRDRGLDGLARCAEWRPAYGLLKLVLELTLPMARWMGRGEVIRVGVEKGVR